MTSKLHFGAIPLSKHKATVDLKEPPAEPDWRRTAICLDQLGLRKQDRKTNKQRLDQGDVPMRHKIEQC